MKRIVSLIFLLLILGGLTGGLAAENYVNWRGGFWFEIPQDWEKVNYSMVDAFLSMTDTSRDVFNYEAVFAPKSSEIFAEEAYLVVTFDSTGTLTQHESDSILQEIAESYSTGVYDAPVVQMMSDLTPGQPRINKAERTVSVLSEMAYRPESMKKLWLYMRLNDRGLVSFYFYSPDSSYQANKPVFDGIVKSLSFTNLKEAAAQDTVVFTGVGGDNVANPKAPAGESGAGGEQAKGGISQIRNILVYAVVIIVVFGLLWNFVLRPRSKKNKTKSE